jgi:hypothetical protein
MNRKLFTLLCVLFFALTSGLSAVGTNPINADASKSPPPSVSQPTASASTVEVSVPSEEVLTEPNELLPEQKAALKSESKPTASPPATAPTTKPWQRCYHPQVTDRIFNVLCYPYYQGGKRYPLSDVLLVPIPSADTVRIDPNQLDPNTKLETINHVLETYCDLIHQWRNINESTGVTLEVVRSIELTRRATGIYHVNSKLAIEVKRTLGRIGRLNCQFDLTSRFALQNLLRRRHDQLITARLEKHVHELQTLLELLCEQNDDIAVALGIGKIDRQAQRSHQAPIYYTNLGLPNVPSQLYKQQ